MQFVFDNNIPIYVQVVEQLKKNIISGKLKSGERLPSVREMANISKANPNTIQKALAELEKMNLIYTERTNGKYVTNDDNLIKKYKNNYIEEITKKYINDMKNLNISIEEINKYIKEYGGK